MPKKKNTSINTGTLLYGYDKIAQSLKKLADERRLSHTYIFFGEPQVGKFLCAQTLANYLERGEWQEPIHPLQETLIIDLTQQEDDVDESAESIGIATARRVTHFLHQQSVLSPYRVVIIRDGEWLTDQAQNALLKTLEEPPEHSVVILIATDSSVFLPAVASRAQKIYFKTLSDDQILDFCNSNGIIKDTNLVQKSFGRIGRLQSLLEPQKNSEAIERLVRDMCTPQTSDMAREKLVDAIIAFDQKNPRNLSMLSEALMIELYAQKKHSRALKEIIQLITNLQTLTLSKRIHLKKLLCLIN